MKRPTQLVTFEGGLNQYFKVDRFINLRDNTAQKPPEHLPQEISNAFKEGAACLVIGCNNAAATMFRLCIDLATRPLLPAPEDNGKPQPNSKTRRDLGLRLAWLFDNELLPTDLRELAKCIREDANDGAHVGSSRVPREITPRRTRCLTIQHRAYGGTRPEQITSIKEIVEWLQSNQ